MKSIALIAAMCLVVAPAFAAEHKLKFQTVSYENIDPNVADYLAPMQADIDALKQEVIDLREDVDALLDDATQPPDPGPDPEPDPTDTTIDIQEYGPYFSRGIPQAPAEFTATVVLRCDDDGGVGAVAACYPDWARVFSSQIGTLKDQHDWMLSATTDGRWRIRICAGGVVAEVSGGVLGTNLEQRVDVVYNGSEAILYVNGEREAGTGLTGMPCNRGYETFIGGANTGPQLTDKAWVDYIRVRSYALAASEIADEFAAEFPDHPTEPPTEPEVPELPEPPEGTSPYLPPEHAELGEMCAREGVIKCVSWDSGDLSEASMVIPAGSNVPQAVIGDVCFQGGGCLENTINGASGQNPTGYTVYNYPLVSSGTLYVAFRIKFTDDLQKKLRENPFPGHHGIKLMQLTPGSRSCDGAEIIWNDNTTTYASTGVTSMIYSCGGDPFWGPGNDLQPPHAACFRGDLNTLHGQGKWATDPPCAMMIDDKWHLVQIRADIGGGIKLWIDGRLVVDADKTKGGKIIGGPYGVAHIGNYMTGYSGEHPGRWRILYDSLIFSTNCITDC